MNLTPGSRVHYGTHGMVASASHRAAAAGLDIMQRGGNAFDAAMAVASVEWLTVTGSCGLGGDVFAVFYDAKEDRTGAINGSGVCAMKASRDYYVSQALSKMPLDGWHAAAVPGAPHAYDTLVWELGTMPMGDLLSRAFTYAEKGIVVSEKMSGKISGAAKKLGKFPDSAAMYLRGSVAPRPGDTWVITDLAQSIRTLAEEGSEPFYRGDIAAEIVRASGEGGGIFGAEEFAEHETDVYEPLHTNYRGVDVYETAPPSQGLIVLEWLNLMAGYDLRSMGAGSAYVIHLLVEAKKLAFADRLRYCSDPRFSDNPCDELLSMDFADQRRESIDHKQASDESVAGCLPEHAGDTSYFAVADGKGNAISFIHSLSAGFGSGVVAGRTGIVLNNRAGRGFSLEEDHPNVIAGGKKTMHTLNCYLLRDGNSCVVGGTPGGDRQPQWNVQTITNLIDFDMDVQEAAEAPRWVSWPGTDPAAIETPFELRLEDRFGSEVISELEQRGHRVSSMGDWGGGSAVQLIMRDENGNLMGGSDPRAGGVALGF
jgi:gamma-glutamyltranspeptidase/glutathione hydrolase